MGFIVELRGPAGYASSFLLFAALAVICLLLAAALKASAPAHASVETEIEKKKMRVA
jgi:hypothetical protein